MGESSSEEPVEVRRALSCAQQDAVGGVARCRQAPPGLELFHCAQALWCLSLSLFPPPPPPSPPSPPLPAAGGSLAERCCQRVCQRVGVHVCFRVLGQKLRSSYMLAVGKHSENSPPSPALLSGAVSARLRSLCGTQEFGKYGTLKSFRKSQAPA